MPPDWKSMRAVKELDLWPNFAIPERLAYTQTNPETKKIPNTYILIDSPFSYGGFLEE